jgi:long-chain acyl-CoA synthetase
LPNVTTTPRQLKDAVARLTGAGGAFEVTERVLSGQTFRVFAHCPAHTLVDILESSRAHGDREFVVFEGDRWSFTDFYGHADALAATLQHDYGVGPGERVAVAMRNCPDWMAVFAAAALIGAIVVPLNSWGSAAELAFTMGDSGAKVVVADVTRARLATGAEQLRSVAILLSNVEGPMAELPTLIEEGWNISTLADAVAQGRGRAYTCVQSRPDESALLMYTSGSTGQPKGVIFRHIALGQAIMGMFFAGVLALECGAAEVSTSAGGDDVHLVTVPLFHTTGLFAGFLLPAFLGHRVVLMRKWEAEAAGLLIAEERITTLGTVPAILKDLLTCPGLADGALTTLTRVTAAGAATPADLPELLERRLGVVSRSAGYGMTETASVGATMSGPVFDLRPMAAGLVSPIIEFRTADVDGNIQPATEEGEVQLRGVTVTPGYWNRADLTAQAFTSDGWIRTGDLGHVDDGGFVHITGRIKEIVIRGGENIAPVEVENVAYRLDGIKEVAVFGVADDAMGEELAMVCYLQPHSQLTVDDVRAHLASVLPRFKVPKHISLADEPLPRNASEKIHRPALQRRFSQV